MSGGKGGNQTSTTKQDPWGPLQPYLQSGLIRQEDTLLNGPGFYTPQNALQVGGQNQALDYANNFGSMFSPYSTASMGALQRPGANDNPFGINGAIQQGMGAQPNPLGLNGALQQQGMQGPSASNNPFGINSAIQQGLQAPNVNSNPYLEQFAQAATRPLEQQLSMSTMPGIRSQFGAAGQAGGSRQGIAEGVAQGLTNQAIGDTRANIFSNAYGQGLNQQTNALSAANQAYGTDINRQQGAFGLANQNYGLGAQERLGSLGAANTAYGQGLDSQARALALYPQVLQSGLTPSNIYSQVGGANQADANQAQIDGYKRLQYFQDAINGTPSGMQSTTAQGGSGSTAMNALGGGVLGQGLGSMLGLGIGGLSGGGVGALAGLLGGLFG